MNNSRAFPKGTRNQTGYEQSAPRKGLPVKVSQSKDTLEGGRSTDLKGDSAGTAIFLDLAALIILIGASLNRSLGHLGSLTVRGDWLTASLAVFGLLWLLASGRRLNWSRPAVLLLGFVSSQFLSSCFNATRWPSGLKFSFLYILVLAVFLFLTSMFQDPSLARRSVFLLIFLGATQACIGLLSVLWSNWLQKPAFFSIQHLDLLTPRGGIYFALGTLIEPNILGSFLLVPFALALWLGQETKSRWIKVSAYLVLVGIVVTGTRAAWIAAAGIYLVWLLRQDKKIGPTMKAGVAALLGILILALPAIRLEISRGTFGWRSLPRDVGLVLTKNFAFAGAGKEWEFFKLRRQDGATGFVEQAVDEAEGSSKVVRGRKVLVSGWAVANRPQNSVSQIDVFLDDDKVGSAALNVERKDVQKLLKQENSLHSGWRFRLDTKDLPRGKHWIEAVAVLGGGSTDRLSGRAEFEIFTTYQPNVGLIGRLSQAVSAVLSDYNLRVRGLVSRIVIRSWRRNLHTMLLGQGAGSVNALGLMKLSKLQQPARLWGQGPGEISDEAPLWVGNVFLHVVHDAGIVGLLIFLAFLFTLLREGLRVRRRRQSPFWDHAQSALFVGVLGILFCFQFSHAIWQTYFYVFVSLLVVAPSLGHDVQKTSANPVASSSNEAARILFVHASSNLYGSDRVLWQIVRGLPSEVRDRSVVVLPYEGPLVGLLRSTGVQVHIGPLAVVRRALLNPTGMFRFGLDYLRSLFFLRSLARPGQFDLVYSNTSAVVSGAALAKWIGIPHVWHIHEILVHPWWFARCSAGFVAASATVVIANSRETAAHFFSLAPRTGAKMRIIYNGAMSEYEGPPPPAATLKRLLGVPADCLLVGLVGRINRWKGHEVFVQAAAQIVGECPSARFLIVGSSFKGQEHFERDLEKTIQSLPQLTGRLYRLSEQQDMAGVYAALDVLAVPSTEPEPFGLTAAEAMALGCPVVASSIGALPELIEDGRSGLLVEPSSVSALADGLRRLLSDRDLRHRLGEAGRQRQRANFSEKRFTAEVQVLLRAVPAQESVAQGYA